MSKLQRMLAKDTVIYGLSSIIGKFLNWLLVPLYTFVLAQQSDYGIVTNLYAWTALLLVILTYGMETGFLRFTNKSDGHPGQVYNTSLVCLFVTSVLFAVLCTSFSHPIANALGYPTHHEFIALMAVVVSMDAFASIPFVYLRYKRKPIKFALYKLLYVGLNIGFNLFFLVLCPKFHWSWYDASYGVGYVFVSNILSTGIQTLCLLPVIFAERHKGHFTWNVLKEMLHYSLPLLILGVCGIMNQTLDRIIFPFLYPYADMQDQLGIYGACFKVAMIMMMFTQAFRYAYEPIVFAKQKDTDAPLAYANAMKYYIIFSLLILLGMLVYLDLLKYIIAPSYWEGLKIVPIVLWSYVFQGVYFNLSFWYKLTDDTRWGAYLSIIAFVVNVVIQVVFVPRCGYMASAFSAGISYLVIMVVSYFLGQKHYPIPYDMRRIGLYTGATIGLLCLFYLSGENLLVGTGTILVYILLVIRKERLSLYRKKYV